MRASLVVLLLAACGGASTPASTTTPAACPVAEPPAPEQPAETPDEAAVIEMSRAFIDAFDRNDVEAFEAAAGPTFATFATGRSYDTPRMVERMRSRVAQKFPSVTRSWTDERVTRSPDALVYVGLAVESLPAEADRPASSVENYNTLVWTRVDGAWKVAHWQRQKGGLEGEREMWNDVFRVSVGFNKQPNQLLVDTVTAHPPRKPKKGKARPRALDLAMGQGRNAIFLAESGYDTTGVDISDEGLKIAAATAAEKKLPLTTVQADMDQWDLGKDRWDLVTLIYAGSSPEMLERIKPAVKKGGLVVVEFFHREATAGTGIGGFETGALAAAFAGWEILVDDVVEDTADWGLRKTKLVRFVARRTE